jgi:PhzF family phenazine biosynthesis protein
MPIKFWIVDTFSKNQFQGNPASVFFVESFDNENLMQNIAMEINTPESIFLKKLQHGDYEAMCFTPNSKGLSFGNGLFAASEVIRSQYQDIKEFKIVSGIRVFIVQINPDSSITIRFSTVSVNKVSMPSELTYALEGEIVVSVCECKDELIVEIRSPKRLFNLNPNIDVLRSIDYDSFIITADTHFEADVDYDFCVKVFAPRLGIFSDITTPIAHAKLAAYWVNRIGKSTMTGFQSSPNRSGYVNIDYKDEYTYITGKCSISTHGEMFCPETL